MADPRDSLPATSPTTPRAGRWERRLAGAFLSLVGVVLSLIVAELVCAYALSPPHMTAWEFPVDNTRLPQPYVVFGARPKPNQPGMLNSLGYPGREPTLDKPIGEFRIFVVGASTVYYGNPTIPEALEQLFWRDGQRDVRVYNLGCISQISGQELARVVHQHLDYQPDLIVHYGGNNDIAMPYNHDPRPNYPYNFLVYEANPLLDTPGALRRGVLSVAGHSHLARTLIGFHFIDWVAPRRELQEQAGQQSEDWRRQMAATYLANLTKSKRIAEAYGTEVVAVFQPQVCYDHFFEQAGAEKANAPPHLVAHLARMRELVLEEADQARRAEGLAFLDLSLLLAQVEPVVFEDFAHLDQAGIPPIAEAIYSALPQLLRNGVTTLRPAAKLGRDERRSWLVTTQQDAIRAELQWDPALASAFRVALDGAEGRAPADARVSRRIMPLVAGKYELRFKAQAAQPRTVLAALAPATQVNRPAGNEQPLQLTDQWQAYRLAFELPAAQDDLCFELQLGGDAAVIEIAEVELRSQAAPDAAPRGAEQPLPAVLRSTEDRQSFWYTHAPQQVATRDRAISPLVRRLEISPTGAPPGQRVSWQRRTPATPAGVQQQTTWMARAQPPRKVRVVVAPWSSSGVSAATYASQEFELNEDWQPVQLAYAPGETTFVSHNLEVGDTAGWIEVDIHGRVDQRLIPFTLEAVTNAESPAP